MKAQHLSHNVWTDLRDDIVLGIRLLAYVVCKPQSDCALNSQPVPLQEANRSVWVAGTGVDGEEMPTCSASFHSLWGYSSRRWGTRERRGQQANRKKPKTNKTQQTQKQKNPIKNGMQKRKGREENATSREQSKKKIKINVKYGNR